MIKKIINFSVVIAVVMMACVNASAQDKSRSLIAGFSPLGMMNVKIKLDDEKYKYNYKSYWGASLAFEKQLRGVSSMTELSFAKASFDDSEIQGTPSSFDPYQTEGITAFTLMEYFGRAINAGQRFQVPIYIGFGGSYLKGGPFHNLTINLGLKVRMKYYVTDKLAVFGGGSLTYGLGSKSTGSEDTFSKHSYSLNSLTIPVEVGLILGI